MKALDHNMATKDKMIPFGILNLEDAPLSIFYGNSSKFQVGNAPHLSQNEKLPVLQ